MSESEPIAAVPPEIEDTPMDAEDRLRPEFVDRVLDAVDAGDDETARELVEPLHPADVADLIELAARDERQGLVRALAEIVDADVLAEMNEHVRETLLDCLEPQQVADVVGQMETDDAVAILEDLEEDEQRAVLRAMEPDDRAAIEEALTYPEESAGRLMQRDLIAVPEHWTVGQIIDYLRADNDGLATDFWEVFVVNAGHHPVGTCKLSAILRSRRDALVSEVMQDEQTLIPVDMDQEDVALRFQKYALVSAAVVDSSGRLVGMITVDDIVHIIQEEASEDALLLSGVDEGDINEPVSESYRSRVRWLIANLLTALVATFVITQFEGAIEQFAILAALMGIVAGVGGNAGTQTLAVTVRAIATNQLTGSNRWRAVGREVRVALLNGITIALIIGSAVAVYGLYDGTPLLGAVIGLAMLGNIVMAGCAGVMVPLALERAGADPAVASSVFVTMFTDSMGFLLFLGLATLFLPMI